MDYELEIKESHEIKGIKTDCSYEGCEKFAVTTMWINAVEFPNAGTPFHVCEDHVDDIFEIYGRSYFNGY